MKALSLIKLLLFSHMLVNCETKRAGEKRRNGFGVGEEIPGERRRWQEPINRRRIASQILRTLRNARHSRRPHWTRPSCMLHESPSSPAGTSLCLSITQLFFLLFNLISSFFFFFFKECRQFLAWWSHGDASWLVGFSCNLHCWSSIYRSFGGNQRFILGRCLCRCGYLIPLM